VEHEAAIVCTSSVLGGQPRLRGRRIQVFNAIWRILEDGLDGFIEDVDIEEEALVRAAIVYCRDRQCLLDKPKFFCAGCTYHLVMQNMTPEEWIRNAPVVSSCEVDHETIARGLNVFLGTPEDMKASITGRDGWAVADRLYNEYRERLALPEVPPRRIAHAL
jgi:uncharacterized protein (DUF433 family)